MQDLKPGHSEPWRVHVYARDNTDDGVVIYSAVDAGIASLNPGALPVDRTLPACRDNAARIVACVNACAGIEDPAAFLADVRALCETLATDATLYHVVDRGRSLLARLP